MLFNVVDVLLKTPPYQARKNSTKLNSQLTLEKKQQHIEQTSPKNRQRPDSMGKSDQKSTKNRRRAEFPREKIDEKSMKISEKSMKIRSLFVVLVVFFCRSRCLSNYTGVSGTAFWMDRFAKIWAGVGRFLSLWLFWICYFSRYSAPLLIRLLPASLHSGASLLGWRFGPRHLRLQERQTEQRQPTSCCGRLATEQQEHENSFLTWR